MQLAVHDSFLRISSGRPLSKSQIYRHRTEMYAVHCTVKRGRDSPYCTIERRVPELIPVLGRQPAGDVSHEPGGRLPLLSARPAVTLATLKRAATNFAAW